MGLVQWAANHWFLAAIFAIFVVIILFNLNRIRAGLLTIRQFFDEVMVEMRKGSWPTKNAVISSTVLVGIATLALMIIIGIVDYGLGRVVKAIFMSS